METMRLGSNIPYAILPQRWKRINTSGSETGQPGRRDLILQKINRLRELSSPLNPICFRCTDRGHTAPQCRNAVLCFICNRFGHRSSTCRAVTKHTTPPNLPNHKPLPDPKIPNPRSNPEPTTPPMTRVVTYHSTPASQGLEKAFFRSFFLEDKLRWGPERVAAGLYQLMSNDNWIVRVYEDYLYLIEAPTKEWLDMVMVQRKLYLENREFTIRPWDPSYDEGYLMMEIWVRLTNFPMKLWHFAEFSRFMEEYGATVLELDPNTAKHMDWRFVRMKVAICDPKKLPKVDWVKYMNPFGKMFRYEVGIEVEEGIADGGGGRVWDNHPPPPPLRNNGGGYRNNRETRPHSRPPPRRNEGGGGDTRGNKGKNLMQTDEPEAVIQQGEKGPTKHLL